MTVRHAILVVLTLALGPVAMDGFRPWAATHPTVAAPPPKSAPLASMVGKVVGGAWCPCPSQTLEWFEPAPIGAGSVPCLGTYSAVGSAIWTGPSK